MNTHILFDRVKRWGLKGGLGLLDQALYSGVNFALSILLARWITPDEYGGFAVAYSIFLLISTLQVALIAEPMSIFGVARQNFNVESYLNALLRFQWLGSILISILLISGSLFLKDQNIRIAQIGMSIALPFTFAYWYLRRACYLEAQTSKALFTSMLYTVSLIIFIVILMGTDTISAVSAFLAIAVSSLFASMFSLRGLGVQLFGSLKGFSDFELQNILSETWGFGKWILAAYIANWIVTMAYPLVIATILGLELAASFRTMQNLFLPLQQFLASITLLALPWMARQKVSYGSDRVLKLSWVVASISGIVAFLYCLMVVLFRYEIVDVLYQNEFYSSFVEFMPSLAIASLISVVPLMLGLSLRVLGKPEAILWSKGISVLFVVTTGLFLVWRLHLDGVMLSLIASALVELFVLFFIYFQHVYTLRRSVL